MYESMTYNECMKVLPKYVHIFKNQKKHLVEGRIATFELYYIISSHM